MVFTPKPDLTAKQSNRLSEFDRSDTTCIKAVILIQLFFQKQCFLIPLGLKNAWYSILFRDNDLCSCVSVKKKVVLAGLLAVPNLCHGRSIY